MSPMNPWPDSSPRFATTDFWQMATVSISPVSALPFAHGKMAISRAAKSSHNSRARCSRFATDRARFLTRRPPIRARAGRAAKTAATGFCARRSSNTILKRCSADTLPATKGASGPIVSARCGSSIPSRQSGPEPTSIVLDLYATTTEGQSVEDHAIPDFPSRELWVLAEARAGADVGASAPPSKQPCNLLIRFKMLRGGRSLENSHARSTVQRFNAEPHEAWTHSAVSGKRLGAA